MNSGEFEKCLKRGKIKKFPKAKQLASKELELAGQDLKIAGESFSEKNYKWSTIQSYYAMFHAARSLLYKKGYREKSHYCLIEAIRHLFVAEKALNFKFIEAMQLGKSLRENADYYGDFDKASAESMLENAKAFLANAKKISKVKRR